MTTYNTDRCRVCNLPFVNDNTPLGLEEICMLCRPTAPTKCDHCQAECRGHYDGLRECDACRSVPTGLRQYEAKQRERYLATLAAEEGAA